LLSLGISDVPEDVAKQLARQAFLTSKVLDHKKDDGDQALNLHDQRLGAHNVAILNRDDDE
ncbi:hypothetical protein AaE_009346, partial [Aphanomyces astaci]